jgi:hypothetical protein
MQVKTYPSAYGIISYGVYQHSSGPQGGFVVKELEDGRVVHGHLYDAATPVATYRHKAPAQRFADKLNYA